MVGHRSPIRHERLRAAVLDRLRLCDSAHDPHAESETLARVWRDLRPRPRKQILHCGLRLRPPRRAASHATPQTLVYPLAFCRRRRRPRSFPSKFDLEPPASLAFSRTDAQHPSHRQGHCLPAACLHRPANLDDESLQPSVLAPRLALLFFLASSETVSQFWLGISNHLRVFPHFPRQGLLFRPRLPDSARRGCRLRRPSAFPQPRTTGERAAVKVAQRSQAGLLRMARHRHLGSSATRSSGIFARRLAALPSASACRAQAHRTQLCRHAASAVFCRRTSLAGASRCRRSCLSLAFARRAGQNRDLLRQLRPGGRHRPFRPALWPSPSDQRASELFSLGTAQLHGRDHDCCRRPRIRRAGGIRFGRSRGSGERSLRLCLRNAPNPSLPWSEREFANSLAPRQELALTPYGLRARLFSTFPSLRSSRFRILHRRAQVSTVEFSDFACQENEPGLLSLPD